MTDVNQLIREYTIASHYANDGMTGTWPTVADYAGVPCTPQIARLHNAQAALTALAGQPDLPAPLQAFLAASADSACNRCWVSSARGRNHPECNAKLDRYFETRAALRAYGREL